MGSPGSGPGVDPSRRAPRSPGKRCRYYYYDQNDHLSMADHAPVAISSFHVHYLAESSLPHPGHWHHHDPYFNMRRLRPRKPKTAVSVSSGQSRKAEHFLRSPRWGAGRGRAPPLAHGRSRLVSAQGGGGPSTQLSARKREDASSRGLVSNGGGSSPSESIRERETVPISALITME